MNKDLPKGKPILCLDFDGVLHSYSSGWQGPRNIPDPPVHDAMRFLVNAIREFDVQIYSSRSRYLFGRYAIKKWLRKYLFDYCYDVFLADALTGCDYEEDLHRWVEEKISQIKFPTRKPATFLQIDDRAICFTGVFPPIEEIKLFKPWNKK